MSADAGLSPAVPTDGKVFHEALHERTFGLWRSDGSAKPAVAEITRRVGLRRVNPPADLPWLDIGVEEFLADRGNQISRLYERYCSIHEVEITQGNPTRSR